MIGYDIALFISDDRVLDNAEVIGRHLDHVSGFYDLLPLSICSSWVWYGVDATLSMALKRRSNRMITTWEMPRAEKFSKKSLCLELSPPISITSYLRPFVPFNSSFEEGSLQVKFVIWYLFPHEMTCQIFCRCNHFYYYFVIFFFLLVAENVYIFKILEFYYYLPL